MAVRRNVTDLLERLAYAEEAFSATEFLTPALRGGIAHVRIAGVLVGLRLEGGFEGWGVFRPQGRERAGFVRPATDAERGRYLRLLPRRQLLLCRRERDHWLAWPAHQADSRF